ncbi:MAG: hypothetical protein E7480_04010 [Ruminococcaceae bacterium]|nr:hypothetical protein [Oscillospiraceae bacterium]
MTNKERFIKALKREPISGYVPHFELVFFLSMESIGKVHPTHRGFGQWNQMSTKEKLAQIKDAASVYVDIAKKYDHSAIFIQGPIHDDIDTYVELINQVNELGEGQYYVTIHGDYTFPIPNGENMVEEAIKFYEEPEKMHEIARENIKNGTNFIDMLLKKGAQLDGITMCSDYCFNDNPFLSPDMFSEFITPYLTEQIKAYKDMGLYTIKHTDGNIMPIIDDLVGAGPDALHSLDPQGGVDLKFVKEKYGDKICLIGNVNCGLLQTGTEEEIIEDCKRALRDGMPGYGYIFSSSNCAYTGLALERYELMHSIWREYGKY